MSRPAASRHRQQPVELVAAHVLAQEVREEVVVEGPEQVLLRRQVGGDGGPVRLVAQEGQVAEGQAGLARLHVLRDDERLDLEAKRWQNGHWKSSQTSMATGASGSPSV